MSLSPTPQPTAVGRTIAKLFDYAVYYGVELLLVSLILYLCISRGLTVSIDMYEPIEPEGTQVSEASLGGVWWQELGKKADTFFGSWSVRVTETDSIRAIDSPTPQVDGLDDFNDVALTDDPAPHLSNLTLVLSPDYGERKGLAPEIIKAKKARVRAYLSRYAPIARQEMRAFGIPASITLAQGLLESNAGDSKLARVSKNHFGIKCKRKCLGCTCRNYGDDTRYDMFRVFDSVAESFREHSELLNTSRYAKLKKHGKDYVKWAHGLKSCGYATDKRYGFKLVKIIENLKLNEYDRV